MKKPILLLLTFLLFSCGKSVYYAYKFSDPINRHYSYCTLEITKKKEVIYRASSDEYLVYPNNLHSYICIYSDKYAAEISKEYYDFGTTTSELWTVEIEDNPKMAFNFIHFDDPFYFAILYEIQQENDTIVCNPSYHERLKKGYGYKENSILWFPEYMVKVDKIDYNKFYKSARHLNLKNPRKN